MKYAWIEGSKLRWPVCVQCRVLGVSASGYRQRRARKKKIATLRHLSETALLVEIRAVYAEARGAYGWPRVSTPASKSACRGPACPPQQAKSACRGPACGGS